MTEAEFTKIYLNKLNESQLSAVKAIDGPVLLLAVPGSGKTTVLVNRLGYMIFNKGINPENILTLTYTVAATKDMANRFARIFGEENRSLVEFRTINGICQKIINRYSEMIGQKPFELISDEKVKGKIVRDILIRKLSEYPTDSDISTANSLITYCKNMMLSSDEIQALGREEGLPLLEIYTEYKDYLKKNGLMDYDDQMTYAYVMLAKTPDLLAYYKNMYRYILVDEAQDTSKIQHLIIGLLAGKDGNLFMVGDEDQSIYGFRAAYPEALLNFEKDHPSARVLVMNQNYRSNANIVSLADRFIKHNKARHDKSMVSTKTASSEVDYVELKNRANQYSYLSKVASRCASETIEVAVLYRDNESVIPLVDVLERENVAYQLRKGDNDFFTNKVVLDVLNIIRFAMNPYDTNLFMSIYFKCNLYMNKSQAMEACRISEERGIEILEAMGYSELSDARLDGRCRGMQTNLRCILKETPGKSMFRIETTMGYGDYVSRNNLSSNKLYILKQLAGRETTIQGFLDRLDFLQAVLKNGERNYASNFILSTIHSSKGLEFDEVYLIDVLDGVFPGRVINGAKDKRETSLFEEERRVFYVGMTRAKERLHIFKYDKEESTFMSELHPITSNPKRVSVNSTKPIRNVASVKYHTEYDDISCDIRIKEGTKVFQKSYGAGEITSIERTGNNMIDKFTVSFAAGIAKSFKYPSAFKYGMRIDE